VTAVLGTAVLGTAVLGTAVLGTAVLGTAVLGTAVLGTAAEVGATVEIRREAGCCSCKVEATEVGALGLLATSGCLGGRASAPIGTAEDAVLVPTVAV
jgi:hypothetical protein